MTEFLAKRVEELLAKAKEEYSKSPATPSPPLVRLRVRLSLFCICAISYGSRSITRATVQLTRRGSVSASWTAWRTRTKYSSFTRSARQESEVFFFFSLEQYLYLLYSYL